MYVCVCIYIYIYIYVSANWVTTHFMFFDRGTFCVFPLTYLYHPKSARAHLFP